MSSQIKAFISDQDPTYQKHAKVLRACDEAGVTIPKGTAEYFGCDSDEAYLDLLEEKLEIEIPYSEWSEDASEGFEILIKDIPHGTYKIRFSNSW